MSAHERAVRLGTATVSKLSFSCPKPQNASHVCFRIDSVTIATCR